MWTYEYTINTSASIESIWNLYSDVTTWPSWDRANEYTTIDGPFRTGATGEMKFIGQDPLKYSLVEVRPKQFFADEVDLGDFTIRFEHHLSSKGPVVTLTDRVIISGPAAEVVGPDLGPKITADIPDQLNAIIELAIAMVEK